MESLSKILWYLEHKDHVNTFIGIAFFALILVGIQISSQLLGGPSPYNLVGGLLIASPIAVLYYSIPEIIRRVSSRSIKKEATSFRENVQFAGEVSEELVDAVDVKILRTIHDVGGNYYTFIPEISQWFPTRNLFRKLGMLFALEYVQIYKNKMTLTSSGLELLELPPFILQAKLPPQIAAVMAKLRMNLSSKNYEGMIVNASKTLEIILRKELQSKTDEEKLNEIIAKPYNRWSLGDLVGAAKKLKILDKISANMITSIVQLRNAAIHPSGMKPEIVAFSLHDQTKAFLRHWFSKDRS